MYTDMVGYTALGQRNESLSLALVEEQRKLIRPILSRFNGREIKTMGDAFLVEFPNALDAVRCAYDIQRATREYNIPLPPESRVHLRIGLHLGDVVESQGDISGDAVNVASRIEPLAADGGVCLTRPVYESMHNKLDVQLVSIGMKSLKNVSEPVEVYRMVMPWEKGELAAPAQLDKTRVAVLPLANFSQESGDDYFADGLTEEMIGTLSKIRELRVISRTSVMQYKGKSKLIPEISRELRAGTILEGSVRKAGNRARVSIQMIDATEDQHVWAEDYDRDLQDIFAVQSDIARKVAEALKVKLLSEEREEIGQAPTTSVEANLHFLRGVYEIDKGGPSNMLRATEHFENAIKQDPRFATAYSSVAGAYIAIAGETMPGDKAFPKAKEYIDRALSLDPELSHAHCWKGWLAFQYDWDWVEAENSLRRAIDFGPSNSSAHGFLGRVLASLARFDEAVSEMKRACELDPASPWMMELFGVVYYMAGLNQEARDMFQRVLDLNPMFAKARMGLAFVDVAEMKVDDAKVEADAAATVDREAFFQANRAMVHASVGSYARAREILEKILAAKEVYVAPAFISAIYYNLGDVERGHEWMKKARDERDPTIPWSSLWPIFGAARKDPRFVSMLHQLKLR